MTQGRKDFDGRLMQLVVEFPNQVWITLKKREETEKFHIFNQQNEQNKLLIDFIEEVEALVYKESGL